jgi:2-keto-3-deoxy-6-phosphogluconate aldolase
MASFLVRAFDLPAVAGNRFADVGGVHTANINALAEAGITFGCGGDNYCPTASVTRAQMGSFLARALGLDPIGGNVFADVGGVHEGNINAIAALGITRGCNSGGTLFCPSKAVNRGQMAAFLHRALC